MPLWKGNGSEEQIVLRIGSDLLMPQARMTGLHRKIYDQGPGLIFDWKYIAHAIDPWDRFSRLRSHSFGPHLLDDGAVHPQIRHLAAEGPRAELNRHHRWRLVAHDSLV